MERKTNLKLGTRLLMLLCLLGIGMIVGSTAALLCASMGLLTQLGLSQVLTFVVPSIAVMVLLYRRPLHEMYLYRAPGWKAILVVVVFYIVSLPAMNWLVSINASMSLPSWMSGAEQIMRELEDNAAQTTRQLLDINNIWQLIPSLLVIGFLAGLSEEILFRGTMLRTMQDSRLGVHAVVWIVAFVFSAIHLQFYGFLPRMLLGAWLGYLLVWTRSLWVPIIAHTLNNCTVVVMSYLANLGMVAKDSGDQLGLPDDGAFPWLALISLVASLAVAVWFGRHCSIKEPQT